MPTYFPPLLPWQHSAWRQTIAQYDSDRLPHALLAGGMAGIGKRQFVHRFVAWLLCDNKASDHQQDNPNAGACGFCPSCLWLKAGTHPRLRLLGGKDGIKVDDIRELQPFLFTTGDKRVVVLDHCEMMTMAAANALLKSLEEPKVGVYLFLISDNVARILPTIKSRVQSLPLLPIDQHCALRYVQQQLQIGMLGELSAPAHYDPAMLLTLARFAPLHAVMLPQTAYFSRRLPWLQTFAALQKQKRTSMQAANYWQDQLSLEDFLLLSQMMVQDLWRIGLGLPSDHRDIGSQKLLHGVHLNANKLTAIDEAMYRAQAALQQNVQEKLTYDALLWQLAI